VGDGGPIGRILSAVRIAGAATPALLVALVGCGGGAESVVPEAAPVASAPRGASVEREAAAPRGGGGSGRECARPGMRARAHYLAELRSMATDPGGPPADAAAKALAMLGDPIGIEELHRILERDPGNRFALGGLVRAGDPEATERALSEIVTADAYGVILLGYGFVDRPHPEVVERLRAVRDDGSVVGDTRDWALTPLALMGDDESLAEVQRRLESARNPEEVTAEAAAALRTGSPLARQLLLDVLRDGRRGDFAHAAAAFGDVPGAADLGLLVEARAATRDPYATIWLDYAILRYCGLPPEH